MCLSSAPITKDTFPLNKKSLIASNVSNMVAGLHLSNSSTNITSFLMPAPFINSANFSLKSSVYPHELLYSPIYLLLLEAWFLHQHLPQPF